MKCRACGKDNAPLKKCCQFCGKFFEGIAINNVTGKLGYRNSDGTFAVFENESEVLLPEELKLIYDEIKKKYKKAKIFLMISVKIRTKATRINITIDEKLLRKLEKFLLNRNETRSSFFAKSIENNLF